MGDNLTPCDLSVDHIDLHPYMLVDPKEANNNTTLLPSLLASKKCCALV